MICPFVTTCHYGPSLSFCHCTNLTNTDATDSGPEPSFDRPAISGVLFRLQNFIKTKKEDMDGVVVGSSPTDGANVEAYLRGPLGLGKRASNVRIVWFSFGSFGSVSFGSSAESKNVVQLRLLWSLTSTDATDSGLEPSFDRPAISGRPAPEVCFGCLLQMSASSWRCLLGLSLGLRVVDYHYLLLINQRRYTSSLTKIYNILI
uniref:Uncharacterized protein n=1 Tax=Tanacetum cinerariifolium TaxID=118510 RepID=A0A699JA07_TANCI|nr:hypothetical protein [Tanacetum cinerariifolium]